MMAKALAKRAAQAPNSLDDSPHINIHALRAFWSRTPFHDEVVESIQRQNRRVIVRLQYHTLILTGVTSYREEQTTFPCVWLRETVDASGNPATLHVELESGSIQVTFRNLRLIRNSDCSVLIPPLDA